MAAEGRTVLVSSHLMSEMALTADHLIIIGRGRLLAASPTDRFMSGARQDVLVRSPRAGELAGLLTARGAAIRPEGDGGLAVTGLDAPAIGDLAAGHGIAVHELVPRHAVPRTGLPGPHRRQHRLPSRNPGSRNETTAS